jgi:hypothetical protein
VDVLVGSKFGCVRIHDVSFIYGKALANHARTAHEGAA